MDFNLRGLMSFFNGFSHFFFGTECLACHRKGLALDPWLCPDCKEELQRLSQKPRRPNPDTLSLFPMAPLTKALVHGLKYGNMPGLAGYLISTAFRERSTFETIQSWGEKLAFIPVPLHPARLRERGYNQAEKLAGAIAAKLGAETARAIERKTFRVSQTTLSKTGRANNVAGAFAWKKGFRWPLGRIPVIVDDVFTTGATSSACLYALEKENLGGFAKVCTLLYEESASAKVDFAADCTAEWLV